MAFNFKNVMILNFIFWSIALVLVAVMGGCHG